MKEDRPIVLMGIKHCGKSTQARLVSKKLSVESYDTDDEVQSMTGKTPREICNKDGTAAFLKAEAEACRNLLKRTAGRRAVIATGGGICNNEEAVRILKEKCTLIYLRVDKETVTSRVIREIKEDKHGRLSCVPSFIEKEHPKNLSDAKRIFGEFYDRREKLYSSITSNAVDVSGLSKSENTDKIIMAVRQIDDSE